MLPTTTNMFKMFNGDHLSSKNFRRHDVCGRLTNTLKFEVQLQGLHISLQVTYWIMGNRSNLCVIFDEKSLL